MTRREARVDVERVLQAVDLADVVHKKPTELSHGMRTVSYTHLTLPTILLV